MSINGVCIKFAQNVLEFEFQKYLRGGVLSALVPSHCNFIPFVNISSRILSLARINTKLQTIWEWRKLKVL